jgi:hypothetical protein
MRALPAAAMVTLAATLSVPPSPAASAALASDQKPRKPTTSAAWVSDVAGMQRKMLTRSFSDKKRTTGRAAEISRPYIEALQPCVQYLDDIVTAAKARQLAAILEPAMKGFSLSGATAKTATERIRAAGDGENRQDVDIHRAWAETALGNMHVDR